jgi:hypothetical protein
VEFISQEIGYLSMQVKEREGKSGNRGRKQKTGERHRKKEEARKIEGYSWYGETDRCWSILTLLPQ